MQRNKEVRKLIAKVLGNPKKAPKYPQEMAVPFLKELALEACHRIGDTHDSVNQRHKQLLRYCQRLNRRVGIIFLRAMLRQNFDVVLAGDNGDLGGYVCGFLDQNRVMEMILDPKIEKATRKVLDDPSAKLPKKNRDLILDRLVMLAGRAMATDAELDKIGSFLQRLFKDDPHEAWELATCIGLERPQVYTRQSFQPFIPH